MTPDRRRALAGHAAMLAFSALIGGSFSFGGLIANRIDPLVLQTLRFALAGVLVGTIAGMTGKLRRADLRRPWRWPLLGSVFAIYFVLMFEGLKTATPVSTAAVMTLTPLMTAGFALVLLRQRTTGHIGLALGIGGLGALWVIFRGDPAALAGFDVGRGEWIYFLGCIAYSAYVPLMRRFSGGESALAATFLVLMSGAAVMLLVGWPQIRATDFTTLPPVVWAGLAYLVIFSTAITFSLMNFASLRLPGAKVMAYTYLTPGWVILWELAFGNGLPALRTAIGIAFTLAALALLLQDDG